VIKIWKRAWEGFDVNWLVLLMKAVGPTIQVTTRRASRLAGALAAASLSIVVTSLLSVGAARPAWAADGDLDPTYGVAGRVTTDFGGIDSVNAAVLQPDGKIVVAGGLTEAGFALARYNTDGSLDATFGSGGKVVTPVGGHIQIAFALALQADGKLVAAGNRGDDFATVRYNSDGSLDTSFGSGGEAVIVFGGFGGARALAVQPDGKVIVGGGAGGPDNGVPAENVVRPAQGRSPPRWPILTGSSTSPLAHRRRPLRDDAASCFFDWRISV
jgi:uncharacterized delta-60 repeat protein